MYMCLLSLVCQAELEQIECRRFPSDLSAGLSFSAEAPLTPLHRNKVKKSLLRSRERGCERLSRQKIWGFSFSSFSSVVIRARLSSSLQIWVFNVKKRNGQTLKESVTGERKLPVSTKLFGVVAYEHKPLGELLTSDTPWRLMYK